MSSPVQAIQKITYHNNAFFVFSIQARGESGKWICSGDIPVTQVRKIDLREGQFEEGETIEFWIKPVMGKKQPIMKRFCYAPQGIDLMIELRGSSTSYLISESII